MLGQGQGDLILSVIKTQVAMELRKHSVLEGRRTYDVRIVGTDYRILLRSKWLPGILKEREVSSTQRDFQC